MILVGCQQLQPRQFTAHAVWLNVGDKFAELRTINLRTSFSVDCYWFMFLRAAVIGIHAGRISCAVRGVISEVEKVVANTGYVIPFYKAFLRAV